MRQLVLAAKETIRRVKAGQDLELKVELGEGLGVGRDAGLAKVGRADQDG